MIMHTEVVPYFSGETKLQGFLARDANLKHPSPAILIAHAWKGLDQFAKDKAVELAKLGYIAFTADVYGEGKIAHSNEEAKELMSPLYKNRSLLLERITSGYQTMKNQPLVDPQKLGGIGFCFGGLTIIELFKSGIDLKGAVSFHGVLSHKGAEILPIASHIKGTILLLHGHDDPMVRPEEVLAVQNEFTEAKIDWEMDIYGNASHAFTNKEANDPGLGLLYNKKADERSWQRMIDFFNDVFK